MNKSLNEAKEIESVASDLFNKIRSRFQSVTLGNEQAKATTDPAKARFFNFTYTGSDGAQFGKVTVSLIDEEGLKIYYGQNISSGMSREQRQEWFKFLRDMRSFAHRNMITFDARDINKSNLELQDVKQQAKADDTFDVSDMPVTESRLYGTSMQSYAECDNTRLRIIHHSQVSDEKRGDRARKIKEIFIETSKGERFLLPHTNLHGARAMARHVNEGGTMYDEIGESINKMVREMSSMRHFVRATKNRQFEDVETSDMARAAIDHYMDLRKNLQHLSNKRHYNEFAENFVPESSDAGDIDVDALRERFVKKVYDDRFTEALPIVYKAYQKHQKSAAAQLGNELDEWAESISETIYAKPDDDEKVEALSELMKQPLLAGIDGIDACSAIAELIGDDDLEDEITNYSQDQGPDADCRPLVKSWLQTNMPELADQIEFGDNDGDDDKTNHINPTSPKMAHPNDQYGAANASIDEPVTDPNVKENSDPLDFLKSLAGLK
ncbi:MAG TPA: hypothetical protein VFM18_19335 [Methanosarcina sp.]|nr:hypothetical protein [Methanosarcina sp.]